MKNPLISIIIPIYNVEKYIADCVRSVIKQDYKNIEIILVDDGSPDNSAKIIDELAKKDERIIVLHKENGGVSSARNAGIKIAKGNYITFIDGDDWVEPNYISYFVKLIEDNDCKIGMNINNFSDLNNKSSNSTYVILSEKAIEWIYLDKIFVAVWNKIYNTDLIKQNNITFDESIWYGEGMLFNIDCLQVTDKIAVGELNVYHQVSNPESAMRKFNLESNYCGIRSLYLQKEHWKKTNSKIESAWKYHRRAFNWSILKGLACSDMEEIYKEEYLQCAKALRKNLFDSIMVPVPLKIKLRYICLALAPFQMAKRAKRKSHK